MAGRDYSDLTAWQRAMDLVQAIYTVSKGFPKDEQYGLTIQMRRAAVSIPSNIAEGQGRRSAGDFHRHLAIAHGSLRELETQLLIAGRLKYISEKELRHAMGMAAETGRVITGLSSSLPKG